MDIPYFLKIIHLRFRSLTTLCIVIYILQSTSTYSISFISEKSVNSLSNHLNLEFKRIWKEKMITVNAYPALVIVLSDLHSLSTILQATQQGSQGSSQQSSKSSNKACSDALRPANSNRSSVRFRKVKLSPHPPPPLVPGKPSDTKTQGYSKSLSRPSARTWPLQGHWASREGYLAYLATKSLIHSRRSLWAPSWNTNI